MDHPKDKQARSASGVGTGDTSEYAPSKAPETREHAENRSEPAGDDRLRPGGTHGASADVGMSGIDRTAVPTEGEPPRQTDFGSATDTLTGDCRPSAVTPPVRSSPGSSRRD